MNPTRESKITLSQINGMISVKLGGMNFERPLSEQESEFWQDVVETALNDYAQARLQNRARAARGAEHSTSSPAGS